MYITSLVSNNYLGSNNCSVENNFHLLVNVLFTSALLFRQLSVRNIIQLRMSIFYTSHHFLLCSSSKSCALCDNCLVYSISLVSINYLGSNKCSVENNFHLLVNVLFTSALLFRLLSVWNIIQFRMLSLHCTSYSILFGFRKAVLFAMTVLYTVPLYFPTTIEVQTTVLLKITFILQVNVLFPIATSVKTTVCMKHYSVYNVYLLHFTSFSPLFLFGKAVLCAITVLYTVPLKFPTTI